MVADQLSAAIGWPVELPGDVGDPAGAEHPQRLDDLGADRREERLPDGRVGDEMNGLAPHGPIVFHR
jgi:hypothetical protein